MKVECPHCHGTVPAEHLDLPTRTAKCPRCDNLSHFKFPAGERFAAAGQDSTSNTAAKPLPEHPPGGITVDRTVNGVRVIRRWFSPSLIFLAFFCTIWDGFLFFWYSAALGGFGKESGDPFDWMMVLFPLGHVAVGVGLTYFTLAGFLNRTVVEITVDRLQAKRGPLPWWGSRDLPTLEVTGIERDTSYKSNGSQRYTVSAAMRDGGIKSLMTGLTKKQSAYIQQWLGQELALPIED